MLYEDVGRWIKDAILYFADWIRVEYAPGLVSLGLIVAAAIVMAVTGAKNYRRNAAIAWLRGTLQQASDRTAFAEKMLEIDRAIRSEAPLDGARRRSARQEIATAWGEYHETMVLPPEGSDTMVVRNSIRPSSFFELDDLNYGPGFSRNWPALFVSVGLLFTFLGLISALAAISTGEVTDASLQELLKAASAKFVMSLTGLACSIALTFWLRLGTGRIEGNLRALCHAIEKRLRFDSIEGIAREQLALARQQETTLKSLATEMVAELSRPLREEVPAAISKAIGEQITPLLDRASRSGSDNVGQMVGDLSSQLSGEIGEAMRSMSGIILQAGERIEHVSGAMGASTGALGEQMQAGSDRMLAAMNEALEAIRENTAEGALSMRKAAEEMRDAADGFKAALEGATHSGAEITRDRMQQAASAAGAEIDAAAQQVGAPMRSLAESLSAAAEKAGESAIRLERMGDAVDRGGQSLASGAKTIDIAAQSFSGAAAPVRDAAISLTRASSDMVSGTKSALDAAQAANVEVASRANATLASAEATLGTSHKAIASSLDAISSLVEEFRTQGERLDTMDSKLGAAFERFASEVQSMLDAMNSHVDDMQGKFGPALDTMNEVVQQAERFIPRATSRPGAAAR